MDLRNYIEQTLLKPDATKEELDAFLQKAKDCKFRGVCVNPYWVKYAKEFLKDSGVIVVTVIGFPLGANITPVKMEEALWAVDEGADEIDMVLNISELKNKNYEMVQNEISVIKTACNGKPLKVIIETDLLTDEEKLKAAELVCKAGADFVKTSTGFVKNGVGATKEDIEMLHSVTKLHNVKIKASGGIRTKDKALSLIEAGADRLGTSSGDILIL